MKKMFFVVAVIAFMASCINSGEKKEVEANNLAKDTLSVLFKDTQLPLVADTTLLFKIETFDSLKSSVIKALSVHMWKEKPTNEDDYTLKDFFRIDSIKSVGKYQQYCDSLQIGMTKNVTAHAVYKTKLDSNTTLLAWALHSTSYEACPSSVSSTLYYTLLYKGQISETYYGGDVNLFADPPSVAMTLKTSKLLQDGSLCIDYRQEVGDSDSLTAEITHSTQNYLLKDGRFNFVSEKIDSLVHTKHSSLF